MTFTQLGRPEPEPVEDTLNIERAKRSERVREVPPEEWDGLELDAYYRPAVRRERGAARRRAAVPARARRRVLRRDRARRPARRDHAVRLRRSHRRRLLGRRTRTGLASGASSRPSSASTRCWRTSGARRSTSRSSRRPWPGGVDRSATCSPACTSSTATRCARPRTPARPSSSTTASASSSRSTRTRCARIDADPFYFFEPAYWERLGRAAARPLRRGHRRRSGRQRALPAEPAVAALPPQRHDRRRPRDRRLDARPARGRALGAGERLRALPPRRRPRRQGRLAAPLQGAASTRRAWSRPRSARRSTTRTPIAS